MLYQTLTTPALLTFDSKVYVHPTLLVLEAHCIISQGQRNTYPFSARCCIVLGATFSNAICLCPQFVHGKRSQGHYSKCSLYVAVIGGYRRASSSLTVSDSHFCSSYGAAQQRLRRLNRIRLTNSAHITLTILGTLNCDSRLAEALLHWVCSLLILAP